MNRRNPSSNRAPGRKSRSVMAFAADSASACSCRRNDAARAVRDWRILAPSVPASWTVVANSTSSGTARSRPRASSAVHGAVPLLTALRQRFPRLRHVFADRVYRGNQLLNALGPNGSWTIEIVERPAGVKGFQLLPRRWVVERTFAWLGRCRRLAKDFEASAATERAWLLVAHLRLLLRRLAKPA